MTGEAPADDLIGQQLDEYRLEALLGRGGMARVYRGFDLLLERPAAIKVIDSSFRTDPEYAARFKREARAIARLKHPHIVGIYRYGQVNDLLYLAMEYIEGDDLSTLLATAYGGQRSVPPEKAGQIIRQVCLALDYIHSRGVIHRDIKPSNIMLDQEGNAILTDFGLARLDPETTQGEIFGTPHYIAPEQVISSAGAVPQSDLYAVGVILYEMFTGKLPFQAEHPHDIAMLHLSEPPPSPRSVNPDVNPALEAVILQALAKEPEERYSTGLALADALDQALHPVPDQDPIPSFIEDQHYQTISQRLHLSYGDDLKRLIIHHQRRLQKLKEQQAIKGINTPPEILTEIEDIEAEIEKLQVELKGDLINEPLGKYRLITRLGRGASADVYQAYDSSLYRYVAIKILHSHLTHDEDFIERLQNEATLLASLDHPNIVQVYDFAYVEDKYYMVLEFIEGPTLQARLSQRRAKEQRFSLAETARLFGYLAAALDYAHARGIIHRDLKPGNIMFTADGRVVLADFGIARIMDAIGQTLTGAILGTLSYLSPEQAQNKPVDKRSDIYSLGVILYEVLTGRLPFQADTPIALLMAHAAEPPPPPTTFNPTLPSGVEQVILKTLSKDPEERYQTAGAMIRELKTAIKAAKSPHSQKEVLSNDPGLAPQPSLEFRYDVFISYSQADRPWVRAELLPRLETAGLKAWLDFRDFEPGIPRPAQIQQTVENSRRMLLILTPDYLKSDWDEFANLIAQTRDPASHDRRLIPLLKAPCDLPLRLQFLWPIDFVDPVDWELAWSKLLATLAAPLPF